MASEDVGALTVQRRESVRLGLRGLPDLLNAGASEEQPLLGFVPAKE
jgi:hypothetical protein